MPNTFRHKVGSLVSLLAILVNLLPPFIPPAQANTENFAPSPSAGAQPAPALINSHAPLTPAAASAASILPGWFKSAPAVHIDLSRTAGLTLARPAALAALPEATTDRRPPTAKIEQPAGTVLPAWFDSSSTNASIAQENKPQPAADILPDWFNPAPATADPSSLAAQP
ncbi:MAG: hypothetical protein U0401_20640, partial [Anaerolineae bacterium]